ncbi:MAG: choice-of-anchor D domain-containing protein [bacterium]|nr:choice-of-anchor D domain-containing protein [bacterium]
MLRFPQNFARLAVVSVAFVFCAGTPAVELLGPSVTGFDVGRGPDDVAIADLDRDGTLDLAVTNIVEGTVSVLLGDGSGGFDRVQDVGVGASPEGLVLVDLDLDGVLDLVTANRDDGTVSVAPGGGDGRFGEAIAIQAGATPVALAAADLDADGDVDIAVVNRNPGTVSILLGDGVGGLSAGPVVGGLGPFPLSIAIADLDGDAALDLAVGNLQADSVSVSHGNGDGSFDPVPVTHDVGRFPTAVVAADFDADGRTDLASVNGFDNSVSILLGTPDGLVRQLPDIEVGVFPLAAEAGDFDADGSVDLVVANFDGDSLSVLLGDGSGAFTRKCLRFDEQDGCVELVVSDPRAVRLGDLDFDGAPDLAVALHDNAKLGVLLGDGFGGVGQARSFPTGNAPQALVSGEFDGDGIPDLVTANTLDGSIGLLLGDGLGAFVPGSAPVEGFESPVGLTVHDFDRDGNLDLAVADREGSPDEVGILLGDGAGGFTRHQDLDLPDSTLAEALAVGDFDCDGEADLVVVHAMRFVFTGNKANVLLGAGDGTFSFHVGLGIRDDSGRPVVADFNGDGAPDLGVTSTIGRSLRLFLGDCAGGFTRVAPDISFESAPASIVVTEFDGNDDPDLLLTLPAQNAIAVLLGRADATFERRAQDIETAEDPRALTVADLNSDGDLDLAVAHPAIDSVSFLLARGWDGKFNSGPSLAVGNDPVALVALDLDLDGTTDVAVAERLESRVSALYGRLGSRSDVDASSRVDGFDVNAVAAAFGLERHEPGYRRGADVSLNGAVDGEDLAFVAARFGNVERQPSPLRPRVTQAPAPAPGSVTLQAAGVEGDLLTLRVEIDADLSPFSAVDFALLFEPDPTADPPEGGQGQVLEWVASRPGDVLAGARGQSVTVQSGGVGRLEVGVGRVPPEDLAASGRGSLVDLVFRARRSGRSLMRFAPFRRELPTLLSIDGCPEPNGCAVPSVAFAGEPIEVEVTIEGSPAAGQKIAFAPSSIDFGEVAPGKTERRELRLSNLGIAPLEILEVRSTSEVFVSYLRRPVTVSPFSFVEVPIEFSPGEQAIHAADLVVESNDLQRPTVFVPVGGSSGFPLAVTPRRVEFGTVAVGDEESRTLVIVNRDTIPHTLSGFEVPDARFLVQVGTSVLQPGERGTVDVRFRPDAASTAREELRLLFDAPENRTIVVPLSGAGDSPLQQPTS